MRLPASKRVKYGKHPLIGVTCQLDFPAILRIDTEAPASFQELIRQKYPVPQERRAITLPPQVGNVPIRLGDATWQFLDNQPESEVWAVTLTNHTIALTTTEYSRWEEFTDRLAGPLKAFVDTYSPTFFVRLGLRYQNVICRSRLDLEGVPWRELFNEQIAGVFTAQELETETDVEHTQTLAIISLGEGRKVRLQHGLVTAQEDSEQCYLIDNDIYLEGHTEIKDATDVLDSLHEASGRLFRWCISDTLNTALEPVDIK